MVQFASYLRRVSCKTRLIFPRINGPIVRERVRKQVCARRQNAILKYSGRRKLPDCRYSRNGEEEEYVNINNKTAKTKAESGFCVKYSTIPGQEFNRVDSSRKC